MGKLHMLIFTIHYMGILGNVRDRGYWNIKESDRLFNDLMAAVPIYAIYGHFYFGFTPFKNSLDSHSS